MTHCVSPTSTCPEPFISSVGFMAVWKHSGFRCQSSGGGVVCWGEEKAAGAGLDCSPAAPAHDGLMAASSARGWMLVWHHGCLLPACSLPCAPFLLRDQILKEQEFGGATAELQKCGKHSYFWSLRHVMGECWLWSPCEDSGSYTGRPAWCETGHKWKGGVISWGTLRLGGGSLPYLGQIAI